MNWKTWVPLVLAIGLGLLAMKIARDVLGKNAKPVAVDRNLVEMVVATRNIPAGAPLRADDLTINRISTDVPLESVFKGTAELEGRVTITPLFKGQPVVESSLTSKGTGSGLQALVPKGMRAITLEINEFSGVAGFLVPGCKVDVVSTISGDAGETISRTVVQNVEVTALGRRQAENPGDAPEPVKSVTLLVNPKQAESIELAAATGRPRLVLRSSGDDSDANSEGVTVAELRGRRTRKDDPWMLTELFRPLPTTQPVTPVSDETGYPMPQPRGRSVKVIRGGVESQVNIPLDDKKSKVMTDAKQ